MQSDLLKNRFRNFSSEIICTLALIFCAFIGMQFTGRLVLQICLTTFAALIFSFASYFLKVNPSVIARSICFSTAFWVIFAVVAQMIIKNTFFIFSSPWRYMFYYDRIGMIFIVIIVITVFQRINAFLKKDLITAICYQKFYSTVSVLFTVFYLVVLIYCFFICRTPGTTNVPPNFVPFTAFKYAFFESGFDYETMILFFGNIAIFIPLGYILYNWFKKGNKKIIFFVLPLFLSSAIEISQYYLGMGFADIDDVILNVIGFWLGGFLKFCFDKFLPIKD